MLFYLCFSIGITLFHGNMDFGYVAGNLWTFRNFRDNCMHSLLAWVNLFRIYNWQVSIFFGVARPPFETKREANPDAHLVVTAEISDWCQPRTFDAVPAGHFSKNHTLPKFPRKVRCGFDSAMCWRQVAKNIILYLNNDIYIYIYILYIRVRFPKWYSRTFPKKDP